MTRVPAMRIDLRLLLIAIIVTFLLYQIPAIGHP
jgi:hypothetical protein